MPGENENQELETGANLVDNDEGAPFVKYDWIELERRFMESEFIFVTDFLRHEQIISNSAKTNGRLNRKTARRGQKKRDLRKYLLEQTKKEMIEAAAKKIASRYRPSGEQLDKMHEAILTLVNNEIARMVEDHKNKKSSLDMKKLETLRKMTKTEKNEPTNITKQTVLVPEDDNDPAKAVLEQYDFDSYDEDINQATDNVSIEAQTPDN